MFANLTHQTHENAEELNDVRVGHRIEASEQRVCDSDGSADNDGDSITNIQDDR